MTLMTKDQRSATSDPLAFAIRKLKTIQRQCGSQKSLDEIWLTVNFALFDLKLTQARKPKPKPKKKKRKVYVCMTPGAFSKDIGDQGYHPMTMPTKPWAR